MIQKSSTLKKYLPFKNSWLSIKDILLAIAVVCSFWGIVSLGFAQNSIKTNRVKDIRFAAHPSYSRIIFDLDKNVRYKILPDFKKGVVSLIFENSKLSKELKNKIVTDKRIASINVVESSTGEVRFDIQLIFTNNTFFHMPLINPSRVVFDIKNKTQNTFKDARVRLAKAVPALTKAAKKAEKAKAKEAAEKAKKKALLKEEVQKLEKESEIILANRGSEGKEDYVKALKTYQSADYLKARGEFSVFLENHPESRYGKDATFLKAESIYKIMTTDPANPSLQPVIAAYEMALGRYPGSRYEDMALFRIAEIYNKVELTVESKAHFKIIMDKFPEGRYGLKARLRRAQILLAEKNYEFAYKELLKVVKKAPSSVEARDATFQIADFYFNNKEYKKSIKVYKDAAKKWPSYAQFHPEVVYNIGETYFMLGKVKKSQSQFFKLVNLYPDHELTPKSLNRIGEIYNLAKMDQASAKVFQETVVRKPDSEEADYGLIRIADLGITNPSMRFNNLIFDYDSFYNPVKTYKDISIKYPRTNLAQMARLREGIAFAKEKSYTAAINKYKELLSEFPDTAIKEDVHALIRESFYKLVDAYYSQKGYLPLLATYHQNLLPFLQNINNPSTLFRIGESYQSIGLYDLAFANYQKVKEFDKKGSFREALIVKVAKIYFDKKNYKKSEELTRKFIKQFRKSKHLQEGKHILADSLYNQGKYAQAVNEYRSFLKRFPKAPGVSEGYYYLADSYYRQKKYKEAIKRYEHSLKIFTLPKDEKEIPQYAADSYFKIGESYFMMKKYATAIQKYQKAIKKYPDNTRVSFAKYIIAKSYNILNQGEDAKTAFKEIKTEPGDGLLNRVARAEIELIDWEKKYLDF